MSTVSIHQPGYLPWLGYFEKIARADVHVFLDDVQYEKNSFDNRNKIRNAEGGVWLTVPVSSKGKFGSNPLNELEISNQTDWNKKHWKSIHLNYFKARHFTEHAPFFEQVYNRRWEKLIDLNLEITQYVLKVLGIQTKTVFASKIQKEGKKSDLVLSLCKTLGASTYISGTFGKDYLELEKFQKEGIQVVFQDYEHPVYNQNFPGFTPYMSIIDLLFNEGPRSLDILTHKAPTGR